MFTTLFVINSILLGFGLTMDAFSVSLANGLREPHMGRGRMCVIAGVYGFFQALMPMIGWVCVHTIVQIFSSVARFVPFIALLLLCYIGWGMIREGREGGEADEAVGSGTLLMQGIATSIDALSVGFTLAEYGLVQALVCALIIAAVTFVVCLGGLRLGRTFGMRFAGRANIAGGIILIAIGAEIFLSSLL